MIRRGWGDEAHPDTAIAGLFTNYILGIEPAEPGFKAFTYRIPASARIGWASGRVPTPHGEISASWLKRKDGALEVYVNVPQGTTCRLELPEPFGEPKTFGPGLHKKMFKPYERNMNHKQAEVCPERQNDKMPGDPAAADGGMELLVSRYADAAAAEQDVSRAAGLRTALKADGSWGDINYFDRKSSDWRVGAHVRVRLCILAADWRRNGSRESLDAAHRALGFWLERRFRNPNWWWNIIGVPMSIGDAGLMMDGELTDEERRGIIELMTVKEPRVTAQNFVWMSEIRLKRGLLARDEALVKSALKDVLREVRMGKTEGIRSDWCFHQHGEQPQFGNYGLNFILSQSSLATLLAGTGFEYPPEKLELVRNLASEGYSWICWKGMMDVSAVGRQLHRDAQRGKAAGVERAFANLEKTGWARPAPRLGFRYFDKSAYAVYRANGFMASVRASTPRIIGTETWINEDNAKGMCMADGALMTYATGREYENVFPLWDDWRMIPGVTAYLGKPVVRKDSRNRRDDIRAGTQGDGGFFEFTFEREGLVAHKKWTFSPDGIVCEGSGISASDGAYEVATCVEHAWAAPDAGVVEQSDAVSSFRNGAFVYTVHAPKDAIRFELAEREGNFNTFMLAHESAPVKGRVFSLRILHGKTQEGRKP